MHIKGFENSPQFVVIGFGIIFIRLHFNAKVPKIQAVITGTQLLKCHLIFERLEVEQVLLLVLLRLLRDFYPWYFVIIHQVHHQVA